MSQNRYIIPLGKTGLGKSAICNKLANADLFQESDDYDSQTKECQRQNIQIEGQNFTIIDTPGFWDSELIESEVQEQIENTITTLDGQVTFVFPVNAFNIRFDMSQQICLLMIKQCIGTNAFNSLLVVITHLNKMETKQANEILEKYKLELPTQLKEELGINIHANRIVPY